MSNRKISQGVFSKQQQKSGNIHINVKHKDITGRGTIVDVDFGKSQQEREECLGNAALIIDTFETYNKCGKLPSELMEECEKYKEMLVGSLKMDADIFDKTTQLMKQNRELIEALKELINTDYDGSDIAFIPAWSACEALLTKIQNNQVQPLERRL